MALTSLPLAAQTLERLIAKATLPQTQRTQHFDGVLGQVLALFQAYVFGIEDRIAGKATRGRSGWNLLRAFSH